MVNLIISAYQVGGARRGAGAGHDVDLLISHPSDPAYHDSLAAVHHSALGRTSGGGVGGSDMGSTRPTDKGVQELLSSEAGGSDDDDEDPSVFVGNKALQSGGQGSGQPLVHALFEDLVTAGWCLFDCRGTQSRYQTTLLSRS